LKFVTGDKVTLTFGDQVVAATVILASQNGRSLALAFVAGHVGAMPVLQGEDGRYRSVITGDEVQLGPLQ